MAEVVATNPANQSGVVILKDQAWSKVYDEDDATPATAKTGATAPSGHYDLGVRGTESAFKVKYTKVTTTALHIIPQFSMDGTAWDDDSNMANVAAVVALQLDFTASTTYTNSDGLVFRGIKVPFRYARFLVWVDGAVDPNEVIEIYALKGAL